MSDNTVLELVHACELAAETLLCWRDAEQWDCADDHTLDTLQAVIVKARRQINYGETDERNDYHELRITAGGSREHYQETGTASQSPG